MASSLNALNVIRIIREARRNHDALSPKVTGIKKWRHGMYVMAAMRLLRIAIKADWRDDEVATIGEIVKEVAAAAREIVGYGREIKQCHQWPSWRNHVCLSTSPETHMQLRRMAFSPLGALKRHGAL